MNRKTIKKINKQVPIILVDWVKSLVSQEESSKVSIDNVDDMLPKLQYVSHNGTYVLGHFSKRWTYKILKKMVKQGHILKDIDYKYFSLHYKDYLYGG